MRMLGGLFGAFVVVTLIELALLIRAGQILGFWTTLGLVVLSAALGSWLVRQQGLRAWTEGNAKLARGEAPTNELFDGLAILFAGGLLLTPGFLTDLVGLSLLVPPVRRWLQSRLFSRWFVVGTASYGRPGPGATIDDAEYEDLSR